MKAIFPNANQLQPIPEGVSANISHNINSTPTNENTEEAVVFGEQTTQSSEAINTSTNYTMGIILPLVFVCLALVVVVIFWIMRVKKND